MAESDPVAQAAPAKKSKIPLFAGLGAMLLLGAGGFYAVFSGLILGSPSEPPVNPESVVVADLPDIAFVPMEPLVIQLGTGVAARHLLFRAQLEVAKPYEAQVILLLPRVMDVLNGYLRAVEVAEIEDRSALIRLRAQMLRRVQIVTGEGRVRDLLVTEFVVN
ncbi:MAG: flagellar basal body-associated FliL family protein [Phaeovulum sp.]|uniref:flagellar basal body-associated FliL family protein n=1 Tax=Phaeovulum sp. TaxID=2934796 RepID=UPI002731AFB7|nr:flagellar basal body-associated FliL family protein [Phaeovulum sp.]MDP2062232.1 flagellar basal body-associated FliL family protein [Phaeovulum sp.]